MLYLNWLAQLALPSNYQDALAWVVDSFSTHLSIYDDDDDGYCLVTNCDFSTIHCSWCLTRSNFDNLRQLLCLKLYGDAYHLQELQHHHVQRLRNRSEVHKLFETEDSQAPIFPGEDLGQGKKLITDELSLLFDMFNTSLLPEMRREQHAWRTEGVSDEQQTEEAADAVEGNAGHVVHFTPHIVNYIRQSLQETKRRLLRSSLLM